MGKQNKKNILLSHGFDFNLPEMNLPSGKKQSLSQTNNTPEGKTTFSAEAILLN